MKRKISLGGVKYISDDGTVHLSKSIESIDDLIELGQMYKPGRKYNINLQKIHAISDILKKLNTMVGLKHIKTTLISQIVYFLQNFHQDEMLHTVIQGPPGAGKTMLAKILGEMYHRMNVFNKDVCLDGNYKFVIARRSDLIGEYLGTTAKKTQKVIDSCNGGVLLIDEAYALGNREGRDSYSKECIDTLNQNLSENKGNFMCIIAGYETELEKSFFNYNEGLRRRFPFVYTMTKYSALELVDILIFMFQRDNWKCNNKKGIEKIIMEHYKEFDHQAGDMETVALITKLEHSKRVLFLDKSKKRIIEPVDIEKAVTSFLEQRHSQKEKQAPPAPCHMYL